jgi:hypothetical protein
MEHPESAAQRLEDFWLAKVEAAEVCYSTAASIQTRAAYRCVLKTFALS